MSLISDSLTLYKREMLIFKANLRTNIMRSIIFPLVIIVFFGNIGSSIIKAPIAVVNLANNRQSIAFLAQLSSSHNIQVTSVSSEPAALAQLQSGAVPLVVVILPTFPSNNPGIAGVQIYYSNTQQTVSIFAVPLVTQIASQFGSKTTANPAAATAQQGPSGEVLSSAVYGSNSSYKTFLTGGLLPMVVIFSALFGGGMSLISDRQLGNLKAFFITPIEKDAIVISRILAGGTQGLISAFVALIIGLLDGATIAMYWPLAIVYITIVVLIISMGFSAVALIVASKVKKVDAYAIFSQAIGLPLWFISGGIVPINSLPGWLQPLSAVDPLTYGSSITRSVMTQGSIIPATALLDIAILGTFTLVCILFSLKVFRSSSSIDN